MNDLARASIDFFAASIRGLSLLNSEKARSAAADYACLESMIFPSWSKAILATSSAILFMVFSSCLCPFGSFVR